MISTTGYNAFLIWEHSSTVKELYRRRCRREEPEMDCARQAAGLLSRWVRPGESLLDAGCGSGYLFHSLEGMGLAYTGIDAAPGLIQIGREEMPRFGCPAEKLICTRIEDLQGKTDHVICLNVLSNIENFHRPLERLLMIAGKTLILRESIWDLPSKYCYVQDTFLNKGVNLHVHVNTYNSSEIQLLARRMGFIATPLMDERTQGKAEQVIGHPHNWSFMVFKKAK